MKAIVEMWANSTPITKRIIAVGVVIVLIIIAVKWNGDIGPFS